MSIEFYNMMKHKYESTKPIRGRDTDVRPIGERRRDWERVVKDGDKYGAHLYDTDCVMFYPNGDFEICTGGWDTPTTASYINNWTPPKVACFKRYGKLWVSLNTPHYGIGGEDVKDYPLERKATFLIKYVDGKYAPAEVPKVYQKVTDRTKSRDVRLPVEPFRNYCKNMLKLADGWVRHELVEQFMDKRDVERDPWGRDKIQFRGEYYSSYIFDGQVSAKNAKILYDYMASATEEEYPNLLVLVAQATNSEDSQVVKTEQVETESWDKKKYMRTIETREYKYRPQSVLTRIDYICKKANDVTKVVEVEAGKVISNAV